MPIKSFNDDKNNEVKKIRHVQNKTQTNPTHSWTQLTTNSVHTTIFMPEDINLSL